MFLGQDGCGKTHLSMAIANELMNRYKNARVFFVDYLRERLRIVI